MTPEQLSTAIVDVLTTLSDEGAITLPDGVPTTVTVERPRQKGHGDYATNIAMQLAKKAGMNPRAFAELVQGRLAAVEGVAGVEIAGPGFLNITVEAGAQGILAQQIVAAGASYGTSDAFAGEKINLEFVSANPTGPLHIGGVRWAAVGDALGRVFSMTGAEVTREYYFNDHGAQIDRFSRSLLASAKGEPAPEDGYGGQYIHDIARAVIEKRPDALELPPADALEAFRAEGVDMMFAEIKQSLHDFGV
ncbi:MAG: arginine--tRNA ligase, partial [Nocardioides sp.]